MILLRRWLDGYFFYIFLPSPLSPSVPPSLLPFSKRKMYYIYEQELSHFYWRHTSWTFEHLHPHQEGNTPKIGNATALLAVTQSTRCVLPKMQRWKFPLSPWLLGECDRLHFPKISEPMYPLVCQCDLGTLPLRGRFSVASSWTSVELWLCWKWHCMTFEVELQKEYSFQLMLQEHSPWEPSHHAVKQRPQGKPPWGPNQQ